MSLSRKYFERLGEPLGDSVTQRVPGNRVIYGGGGGGGSSNPDTRYANLDQLYGTQNQASQFMLNNAMPYIPQLTTNSAGMVEDAMDGTLAEQMRTASGNNAQASLGAALEANQRNLQRFGMNLGANRAASESNRNAIMGAAMKAGEMNKANLAAEDAKWNRNANLYGQVMGMNNGAMQGMSSAGAGMNSMNAQQGANDRANAAGYGQAGQAFSSALFKADGGEVSKDEVAPKLASGGNAWEAYKAANPVVSGGYGGTRRNGSSFGMIVGGALPGLAGAGLKDVLNLDGKGGNIAKLGKKAYEGIKALGKDGASAKQAVDPAFAEDAPMQNGVDPAFAEDAPMLASGAEGAGAATDMAAGMSATSAGGDISQNSYDALMAMETASAASSAADSASMMSDINSAGMGGFARGGYIKKKENCLAMGGMPTMSKMSVADNANVSGMDNNNAMSLSKMDDMPKPVNAVRAGSAGFSGKTDGMGESSPNDPDGFGKEGADNRHLAGKGVLSYYKLGFLADAIHPIMEPITRTLVTTGDNITGNSAGAMVLDPQGTMASGKYSGETIAKDWATEHGKITAGAAVLGGDPVTAAIAGKLGGLFADGGDVERTDMKPGGEVSGPGTETSDDIPAWLSDGEYVLNAEAVKLVGKDKLEEINNKGLEVREKKKVGFKLAGGGFLGGNMGIAMGAGVDQWNKQQALDIASEEAQRRKEEFDWKRQEREEANAYKSAVKDIGTREATAVAGNATTISGALAEAKNQGVYSPEVETAVKSNIADQNRQDKINFNQEYINAARKYGLTDKVDALEKANLVQRVGADVKSAATDPVIKAIADADPITAAKLHIGETALKEKFEQNQKIQDARYKQAMDVLQAKIDAGLAGGRGAGSKSGVSTEDKNLQGEIDHHRKMIEDWGKDGFIGADGKPAALNRDDLVANAQVIYNDLLAGGKVAPSRARQYALEMTKGAYGLPSNYKSDLTIDDDGNFNVAVRDNRSNNHTLTMFKNIGNPGSFLGGTPEQQAAALDERRAKAALSKFGNEATVRKYAKMTPDDIDKEEAKVKADGGTFDRAKLNRFVEYAKVYDRKFPAKDKVGDKPPVSNGSDFFDATGRVNANLPKGHTAGLAEYLSEWLNPKYKTNQ